MTRNTILTGLDVLSKAMCKKGQHFTCSVMILISGFVCFDQAHAQPTVESFEWLDGIVDSSFITPTGVNDDGDLTGVYVRRVLSQNVGTAFAYVDDSFTSLSGGALLTSRANAINNNGKVVGYLDNGTRTVGFTWNGGSINQVDIPNASTGRTELWGVNESGVAVGVYTLVMIENGQPVTEQHHFTIPGEDLGIFDTEAPNAINDNGVVAGLNGFFPSGEIIDPREVYLYADGVLTTLGQPAINSGLSVSGINNNNQIAVNWFDDVDFEFRASVWDPDQGYVDVPTLPTLPYITADGINDAGAVVGNNYSFSDSAAYLSYEGQTYDLADLATDFLDGGELVTATDISNGNWIVGYGSYNGTPRAPFRMRVSLESTIRWVEPAGGLFATAENWSTNAVPRATDTALFDLPGAYEVVLDADAAVGEIQVTEGQVTFDASAFQLTSGSLTVGGGTSQAEVILTSGDGIVASASVASFDLPIARTNHNPRTTHSSNEALVLPLGKLRIIGGDDESDEQVFIENRVIVEGELLIETAGVLVTPIVIIGDEGRDGTLEMTSISASIDKSALLKAGTVVLGDDQNFGVIDGGKGTLEVGVNSEAELKFLKIGDGGEGVVVVTDGGFLTVDENVVLGDNLLADGQLTVEGRNSAMFVDGTLTVGRAGTGDIFVADGGSLSVQGQTFVGAGDTVSVSGVAPATSPGELPENSVLLLGADMTLGVSAELFVSNGASLEVQEGQDVILSLNKGSRVQLGSLNGESAVIGRNDEDVGNLSIEIGVPNSSISGLATLLVSDDGTVVADQIRIGIENLLLGGTTGRLRISPVGVGGAPIVESEVLVIGPSGLVEIEDGGELVVGSPEAIEALRASPIGPFLGNKLTIVEDGIVVFGGTIRTLNPSPIQLPFSTGVLIENGGELEVGQSPGEATLIGDLQINPGGTWTVEFAGNTPGLEYDVLTVEGQVLMEGSIVLKFIDGFAPMAGDEFDFITATGDIDLTSAMFEIEGLRDGFEFSIQASSGGFQLLALNDGVAIPEPSSGVILILCGLTSLFGCRVAKTPK